MSDVHQTGGSPGTKKLLKLHFHVVGARSLEEAVFLRYVDYLREEHPGVDLPGLFADERLFEDARRLMNELGEETFFAPMNPQGGQGTGRLGQYSAAKVWDRERFEAAATSSSPEVRAELFNALVKTRFAAFAEDSRQFLDLDEGLGVMGRHAHGLGYEGAVLFLDELVLWLASRASDMAWFHHEVQKMVKLVEAQEGDRAIPFVSFIARQRNLAEMVGESYAGVDNKRLEDSLQWSGGRYETITLEDRNLPAIAEKRVLKPATPQSKETLDEAFQKMKRSAAETTWRTMLGALDAQDFRRLYPFSPALVEALVALSNSLQRERTAIKLLTELLVEHIEDLTLGDIVGVGDLYDVLAGGEDSAEGPMKARFESAKQLYTHQFLPILQEKHGTTTPEKCQRLRDSHPARLGCSNCPVKACRTDNRLVKTLIIASLVPEVSSLKDMTASKLAALNHGSLKVPLPGTESMLVAKSLREWAAQVGQLHVGDGGDPSVSLQLEGVDLKPILEEHKHFDTPGARQRVLKELLFGALQLEVSTEWGRDHKFKDWRGTDRLGHIRFGNVRKMNTDALRCPDDHDWRLVIDYPFDDEGYGPHDDEVVLEKFKEDTGGSWTLVWLPSFFSAGTNQMLGDLAVLDGILATESSIRQATSRLSTENQIRARNDLTNLRSQKRARIQQALEQAYGLTKAQERDIDLGQTAEEHLHVLKPGARIQAEVAANLATALDAYIPALLEARYPRHPRFTKKLTNKRVEDLVARFGSIIDADEKRIQVDRSVIEEMGGTLGELGIVRTTETAVHLVSDRMLQELENKRQQQATERPEVGELRRWIDESGRMGLQGVAEDLIIRCYARWAARTFVSGDQSFAPAAGKTMPDHVVLEKPDLPSQSEWVTAIDRAGTTFGIALPGRALHADNLKRFEGALADKLKAVAGACTRLPDALRRRCEELGVETSCDRAITADSAEHLCAGLQGKDGKAQVEFLSTFEPKTSARAVGASVGSAGQVASALENSLVFGAFTQLVARQEGLVGASELLDKVRAVLRQDELNQPAAERLRMLAEEAQRMLTPVDPEPTPRQPEPPPVGAGPPVIDRSLAAASLEEVCELLEDARAKVDAADGSAARYSVALRIVKTEK